MTKLAAGVKISRYIFSDGRFSRPEKKNPDYVRIKASAVAPMFNESKKILETSVIRVDPFCHDKCMKAGTEYVAPNVGEDLVAYVNFESAVAHDVGLSVSHDQVGHPEHCVIIEWPTAKEDTLEKSKDLAEEISKHSSKIFHEV